LSQALATVFEYIEQQLYLYNYSKMELIVRDETEISREAYLKKGLNLLAIIDSLHALRNHPISGAGQLFVRTYDELDRTLQSGSDGRLDLEASDFQQIAQGARAAFEKYAGFQQLEVLIGSLPGLLPILISRQCLKTPAGLLACRGWPIPRGIVGASR
jgi:hypothetical protein